MDRRCFKALWNLTGLAHGRPNPAALPASAPPGSVRHLRSRRRVRSEGRGPGALSSLSTSRTNRESTAAFSLRAHLRPTGTVLSLKQLTPFHDEFARRFVPFMNFFALPHPACRLAVSSFELELRNQAPCPTSMLQCRYKQVFESGSCLAPCQSRSPKSLSPPSSRSARGSTY